MYVIKFKRKNQFFWRKRKVTGQSRQGSRMVLSLVDGTFEDLADIDSVDLKFDSGLVKYREELQLEAARKAAKDKQEKDDAAKQVEQELIKNADVSGLQK